MENFINDDPNVVFKFRMKKYYPLVMLAIAMSISIVVVIGMAILTQSIFFTIIILLFILVSYLNFRIYAKRGRFYISNFSSDSEKINLTYYDKDEYKRVSIRWDELDYNFGRIKGDNFLVLWNNTDEVCLIYRSFGRHRQLFDKLKTAFLQNIPQERIKKVNSILLFNAFECSYTKYYSYKMFT